jgi:hypothetical protein
MAFLGCLPLGLVVLIAGCDTGPKPNYQTAEVSGKVLFKGKGLTGGRINFISDVGGLSGGANIDEQGNYKVTDAPVGPVHITVDNRMLNKQRGAKSPHLNNPNAPPPSEIPGVYIVIPNKYYVAETTPETFKVEAGQAQTHDVRLD